MTLADKLKLIALNMVNIYDGGKQAGYKDGKDSERQTFWYDFQEGGNRKAYNNAFQNVWTDAMFNPIYDIRPTVSSFNEIPSYSF